MVNGKQQINYTPNNNFFGSDSFTYTISDGKGGTATKTLSVNVNPVDDIPVIASLAAQNLNEDNALNINLLAGSSDVDGDVLTAITNSNPAHGILTKLTINQQSPARLLHNLAK